MVDLAQSLQSTINASAAILPQDLTLLEQGINVVGSQAELIVSGVQTLTTGLMGLADKALGSLSANFMNSATQIIDHNLLKNEFSADEMLEMFTYGAVFAIAGRALWSFLGGRGGKGGRRS